MRVSFSQGTFFKKLMVVTAFSIAVLFVISPIQGAVNPLMDFAAPVSPSAINGNAISSSVISQTVLPSVSTGSSQSNVCMSFPETLL